jgi:predicted dehydrogenase/N-acetylglutamate synthase-like GNAT family acetyltransferase
MNKIKVGIAGAGGRGGNFKDALEFNGATIQAVCDINAEKLLQSADIFNAPEAYCDYDEMIKNADIDAVIIGTPMQYHAEQSIKSLSAGKATLCEVTAGVSADECKKLTECAAQAKSIYMMAENYIYTKTVMLITELVKQGLFGDVYYAEGEYLHELKELNEETPWRRKWQTGIEGITYGTHSLGPILQWMTGDRVAKVCCEGAGYHHIDIRGDNYQQDSPVMLCKTVQSRLIKIRVDMLSDRPHACNNHVLQGNDGVFESSRGAGDIDKIWLRNVNTSMNWLGLDALMNVNELANKYLPIEWRDDNLYKYGHGGGDYLIIRDFLSAVRGECIPKIGIHEAMDMTLPGLMSQQAILNNNWVNVPDSRKWAANELPPSQLRMTWPINKTAGAINIPDGYILRQFDYENDKEQYLQLMIKAGFDYWKSEKVTDVNRMAFPGCFFVIEHVATKKIIATAHGLHNCNFGWSNAAELSWVAADSDHKGKGLGYAVCMAVIKRILEMKYTNIFLLTDDHRIPAISVYLKMGFIPAMYREDMPSRWDAIYGMLSNK